MTDDTSTWLKKNPLIHPMGRSLKTSLRFHVNGSEMDASIISNPGKVNDKQIFVPRLMQRPSLVTKKLNQKFKFKVPTNVPAGKETAKETEKPKTEAKSSVCGPPRKSFLPVKNQPQSNENNPVVRSLMRASFLSRSSARKNTSRRDLIQKFVDASQKNNLAGSVLPAMVTSSTQSVEKTIIRSILKKQRASLRRTSQMSSDHRAKPKSVKKVLFEGFENACAEKEKETELTFSSLTNQSDVDLTPLDEPTVFLNLPKSSRAESSPMERKMADEKEEEEEVAVVEPEVEPVDAIDLGQVLKSWRIYVKKMDQLKSRGNELRNCLRTHLEQSQILQDQFKSYVKSCEDSFDELSRIEREMEENLMKSLEGGKENETPKSWRRNSREGGKPRRENSGKIKISANSKVIQKSKKKLKPLKKSYLPTNNE